MKCTKVNNPCKICLKSVSKKNGLQCQGACQKWAHYKCLNYTPGKIQDIKAGVIKVICPCPDCETLESKEVLTDPPFTCTNVKCPANELPICASTECPSKYPMPFSKPMEHSGAVNPVPIPPPMASIVPSCPTQVPCPQKASPASPRRRSPSPKRSPPTAKGFSPKQSQSCSNLINPSSPGKPIGIHLRTASSEPQLSDINLDKNVIFSALENLCNTVSQLSTQLRDLICKMKEIRT